MLQYDERAGSVRICYTLIDKEVNAPSVNCTTLLWMKDGKRILAGCEFPLFSLSRFLWFSFSSKLHLADTNAYLKLWHVTAKTALLTRNETEVSPFVPNLNIQEDMIKAVFEQRQAVEATDEERKLKKL